MPGRVASSALFFSVALASLAGCDTSVAPVDAAPPGDAFQAPMSRFLGACISDAQCPGNTSFCRTAEQGFPRGQCTNPCTDRTDCDDGSAYNECLAMTGSTTMACEAYCRNGSDCRDGYTCQNLSTDASGATRGICIPACANDAECGGASQCNAYTGRCVPHGTVPTTGGDTGDGCAADSACRSSNCRLSQESGSYTGYVGGYCESICRIPSGYNTNDFFSGGALPQGTCASASAVCLPGGNQQGANDLGVCLHGCSGNSDCRAGYSCTQTVSGHTFTNGFCVPIDCLTGGACPSGSTCHMGTNSAGTAVGICG